MDFSTIMSKATTGENQHQFPRSVPALIKLFINAKYGSMTDNGRFESMFVYAYESGHWTVVLKGCGSVGNNGKV